MGDYVPNIVLLFHKEQEEEKRRKNKMTDIKVGDKKYIPVKIDATMTGLNSGTKVRVVLPTGDKLWIDPLMLEEPATMSVTVSPQIKKVCNTPEEE